MAKLVSKYFTISVGIILMASAGGAVWGMSAALAIAGIWLFLVGCCINNED